MIVFSPQNKRKGSGGTWVYKAHSGAEPSLLGHASRAGISSPSRAMSQTLPPWHVCWGHMHLPTQPIPRCVQCPVSHHILTDLDLCTNVKMKNDLVPRRHTFQLIPSGNNISTFLYSPGLAYSLHMVLWLPEGGQDQLPAQCPKTWGRCWIWWQHIHTNRLWTILLLT